jgi:hypothetical protein
MNTYVTQDGYQVTPKQMQDMRDLIWTTTKTLLTTNQLLRLVDLFKKGDLHENF